MVAITFDTLEFTEQLKAVGVPDEQAKGQAKAFATAIRQVQEGRQDTLATKRDIKEIELKIKELEVKLVDGKAEIIKWMFGVSAAQVTLIVALIKLLPGGH